MQDDILKFKLKEPLSLVAKQDLRQPFLVIANLSQRVLKQVVTAWGLL